MSCSRDSPQPPPKQSNTLVQVVEASEEQEEIAKMSEQEVTETVSDEVYVAYKCTSLLEGSLSHPSDIVEASSLASLLLPPLTYGLPNAIPQEVITSGHLTDLQLEGIAYACQRHQMILPNNTRAGFFIGDAAGVGKGRQIAGIIFDNYVRGRFKHLWFSISSDLRADAKRVFGLPADLKDGVVFSTYATLVSSVQQAGGSRRTRLQQLIEWCGGLEFSGCLIFDECHRAKNYNPNNEKTSTKVAVAVSTLQRMLPKARVVYCSATGVSHVKNMAFMERLGLWGEGTAFKCFDTFLESITRRGLGAAEMLAMEMKTSGMFVSRGLSFKHTEFETIEVKLTKEQEKLYNTAAHIWNELRKSLEHAQKRTNTASKSLNASFWGAHQRFFKQLCLSMKVPSIVSETKKALESGNCVVIGLQTTGEASMVSEMKTSGGMVSGWVSITQEILERFITSFFPTEMKNESDTYQDQWCVTAKKMLLDFTKGCNFPASPLDDIIDKLGGPSQVAEMTGRQGRIVRTARGLKYEVREICPGTGMESLNIKERNCFLNGTKLIAIISEAASTGVSLHADRRTTNHKRRVHLTFELPWSADKAVQQLGRTHRSNQSSAPIYKLVTTNLGGERRFAAAVAQRLQSLGALTQGDRRAASAVNLSGFNFDTPYGRTALQTVYESICASRLSPGVLLSSVTSRVSQAAGLSVMQFTQTLQQCLHQMGLLSDSDIDLKVRDRDAGDIGKFLNRILGLQVIHQNLTFSYFCETAKMTIDVAKQEGRYNEGVTDIVASSVKLTQEPQFVFQEGRLTHQKTKHLTVLVDRGVDYPSAAKLLEGAQGNDSGFYWSKKERRGQRLHLLAIQKPNAPHLFQIVRPNTGKSPFEEEKEELVQRYVRISSTDAAPGWNKQYDMTLEKCIHGANCQSANKCRVGSRTTEIHLLSGALIPIWSVLESTLYRHAESLHLTKNERSLRIVRLQLDSGQRIIGVRYPLPLIIEVASQLKQFSHALLSSKESNVAERPAEVIIEPESPVVPKFLSRATTLPVTIQKFFFSSKNGCQNEISPANVDVTSEVNSRHVTKSLTSHSLGRKRPKLQASNAAGHNTLSIAHAFQQKPKRKPDCTDESDCEKQGVPYEKSQCPICQKTFTSSVSNLDINRHIDDCLKRV
ncbi:uncharacterized protein LOC134196225 isoform X2 [Corticium candelabrum]|uniref:uncharacterized protein LOC134196225 isoform X2 n=1 Tax=Corticium candelabrum TaxID=121492 RepID=UPI002E271584|nr:uncharacterized protein LOC134196225 isoform X2 [Corticium candelabrum]